MNDVKMSEDFSTAFRARLVEHVGRPKRRRLLIGFGLGAAVLMGGTVAAAATGLLSLPGETVVSEVGANQTGTFTGSGSLDLGARPDGTTSVTLSFTCLTPGSFVFGDGATVVCSAPEDSTQPPRHLLPVDVMDGTEVTVNTSPEAGWSLTAGYVVAETSHWETDGDGLTYGVINGNGEPDLIAVIATNGNLGYVHKSELEEADGTAAAREFKSPEDALRWQEENSGVVHVIPVYEADGKTKIGEFRIDG